MKRKLITSLLVLTLIIASITPTQRAEAAAKLSKTNITVNVGSSATISVKGGKVSKWSVKNNKIKITGYTNKIATIQAMSKGTTYLYAKVGGKKLKCKVTCKVYQSSSAQEVKSNFNEKAASENITKNQFKANGYICVEMKSNYDIPTDISATCNFVNSSGQVVDYTTDYASFLEKGHKIYLLFYDSDKDYSNLDIKYEYTESAKYLEVKSIISDLKLTDSYIYDEYDPYIMLTLTNGGSKKCTYAKVFIVYYDSANNIIDIESETFGDIPDGSSANEKSYSPYDRVNYDNINYDHYEAFIGYAYNW